MALLRAGEPGGFVVTAVRQTGGRGRQGRSWASPPGNLYASVGLRLSVAPRHAPQLGFVAGVALVEVLARRLGNDPRLRLKWPNDAIFAGAKLAGLLLESAPGGDALLCVIGYGVNCRSHPDGLPYAATDLAAAGDPAPDPALLLPELCTELAARLSLWDNGRNFPDIRAAWVARAIDTGTRLVVSLATGPRTGTFDGVDAEGRLLLATEDGRLAVDAGDVFFPPGDGTSGQGIRS